MPTTDTECVRAALATRSVLYRHVLVRGGPMVGLRYWMALPIDTATRSAGWITGCEPGESNCQ